MNYITYILYSIPFYNKIKDISKSIEPDSRHTYYIIKFMYKNKTMNKTKHRMVKKENFKSTYRT